MSSSKLLGEMFLGGGGANCAEQMSGGSFVGRGIFCREECPWRTAQGKLSA